MADRHGPSTMLRSPRVRFGVDFGEGAGKRFLNDELEFDGTPEGFDRVVEAWRLAVHEKASAPDRPCGHQGPWHT